MATILKCKMCGGDIEVSQDMTVGKCLFCGSTMTLPRIDSDKKARLFNRANEYRQACDFDKAYRSYEAIVEEDAEEAEAYWGLILSEYGVEYVVDPATEKRIPTCHRTSPEPIQNTVNYKKACQYADPESRLMYEEEAVALDKLQRKILAISTKEAPYDVFICYKESDENGERTKDSVLAFSIYEELEKRNIRTFMSRVSLEDKLGVDYEPYIYSALSSAKVLLVVATNGDHCNSVWVKNEWMRFLSFMDKDTSKMIIPVYKEMSPYDFPIELSKFQAADFEKIGAMQDLIHGIEKYVKPTEKKPEGITAEMLSEALRKDSQRRTIKGIIIFGVIAALVLGAAIFGVYKYREYIEKKNAEMEQESLEMLGGSGDAAELVEETSVETTEEEKDYEWRIGPVYINPEPEVFSNYDGNPAGATSLYANFEILNGDEDGVCRMYTYWEISALGQTWNDIVDMTEDSVCRVGMKPYFGIFSGDGTALPPGTYKVTVYEEETKRMLGSNKIVIN